MLHYGEPVNGYYNPERPQGIVAFGDNTLINGPDVLCPVSIGNYEIRHNYNTPLSWTFLSDIEWSTSANLEVISTSLEEADIRANSGLNPSFVQVSYNETRSLDQYYATPLGENWPLSQISTLQTNGDFVDDKCFFTARKPVVTTSDAYYFTWEADHCQGNYQFHAEGGVFENVSFNWTLEVLGSSTIITLQGKDPSLCCSQLSGQIMRVTLTVSSECGEYVSVNYVYYYCYGSGPNLRATPNPAQDYIAVNIINGEDESFYNITDPSGVRIRINPAYGGTTVMDTQIHANGESIMVSNLQNGVYDLEASATDFAIPLHTTIVIAR
ncbi:MAG: T9SS type A sorting domain-containing protein [Lewinellaceae bacterium]|nr:T9SS type A sorting domain-containing protein [Lewinellaceae bacterium]